MKEIQQGLRPCFVQPIPFVHQLQDATGNLVEITFQLFWDSRALTLAEKYLGVSLLSKESFGKNSFEKLTVMFWAAIQKFNPEYAGEQGLATVQSYFTFLDSVKLTQAVVAAFNSGVHEHEQQESVQPLSVRVN